ncbi:hypothetical protein HDU76_003278 [Blyttiomyces sp. JEL0837]|nr:hypothetical protein HDU76_003278 [Blyttiomyces sp. JEL0837]
MEWTHVAQFVRQLVVDESRWYHVNTQLDKGVAYIQQDFLVTVMIDISGYSKVTSMLTRLGKVSSEIITKTVGAYLNQLIDVVSLYNGDIVKFLGDAILVTFESIDKCNRTKESTEHDVMIRAILCCLHILNECSEFEVDLGEFGKGLDISSQVNQSATSNNYVSDTWESSDRRVMSLKRQKSVRHRDHEKTMLYLHLALTAGTTSRVVMGIPSERLDYSISGDHLSILGTILEGTSQGELGIDNNIWKALFEFSTFEEQVTRFVSFTSGFVKCSTLACQKLSSYFFNDLKVDIDKYTSVIVQDNSSVQQQVSESGLAKFVNQSVWKKLMGLRLGMRSSVAVADGSQNVLSRHSTLAGRQREHIRRLSMVNPILTVNDEAASLFTGDENKEVEKTGLVLAAEFRTVTVVFVKLHSEFNKQLSQVATAGFLACLKKYEGVFQQFSVDDKGQTFLAVFGLPPLSHPNEPEQAVKAMAEYVDFATECLPYQISIGLSTGEILFATLGNDARREAGLLGDIVNVAARLMSLKNLGEIVIDEATHTGSSHLFEHKDIGEHQVKGKENALHLWNVIKTGTNSTSNVQLTEEISGYNEERSVIMQAYTEWKDHTKDGIIIVEGASGLGKSKLGSFISNLAAADGIAVCLVQGTEIEQRTPYFGMGGVIWFIFNYFKNNQFMNQKQPKPSDGSIPSLQIPPQFQTNKSNTSFWKNSGLSVASRVSVVTSHSMASRNVKNDSVNASDERKLVITKFMEYHGQDPDMAPLLGIVAPLLKIKDTHKTERLDPQAKNNLLKSLLLRLVNSFVAKHKCVFLFDDSQEFIAVLSRPIALSGSEILQNIAKNQKAKHIELKGLSREAVEEIIGKKFQQSGKPISNIQESLLDAIVQKGSCFPLYTDMIGFLLQDKVGNELIIDKVGCLKLRSDINDVNSVLLDTVSAGIMAQFDRLPGGFQGILRVACCLGQYFNLDVVRKVGEFDMQILEMKQVIEQNDRYSFLHVIEEDGHHDLNDMNESSAVSCSFRHISIMNAIYESLSYSERVSVNLTAAELLETSLTPENEDLVLPIMSFHYSRTNNYEKHVWCLEKLGCKYVEQCTFFEGIQTLTKLDELCRSLEAEDTLTIDGLRRGRWLSELSWASVQSKNMAVAVSAAMDALDLISNNTWPHEEAAVKKQFVRSLLRLFKLWIGTKGGTQPLNDGRQIESQKSVTPFNSSVAGEKISRNAVLERSLSTLSLVTIYDPSFQSAMSALVIIELLCLVIVKAHREQFYWRVYLTRGAFIFHFAIKPLAKVFYSKLRKVDIIGIQSKGHYLQFGILTAMIKPNATKAVSLLWGYSRWSEDRGDIAGVHASNLYLGVMCLMMGESFDSVETVLLRLTSDQNYYDPLWSITAMAILLRKRLLEMNFEAAQTYFIQLREAMAKSAITFNPVSQAGLLYMESVSSVMAGNLTDAIALFQRAATNALFINKLSVNAIEVMWSYGVFIWLIIDSKGFGFLDRQNAYLNTETKQTLILALQDSCKLMRFLGIKYEICQCWWVLHLYVAALDIVKGEPEVAVSKLSRQLISRRRHEIGDLKLILAAYYGVIARYSTRQADRTVCRERARRLFSARKMEWTPVARFVRQLVVDESRWYRVNTQLDKGVAYIQQDFLVMIDISGYSKVTSMLTKFGKVSSEIITKTVGGYLNQLINVVSFFNGDIVKFVGEAILVTFESIDNCNLTKKSTDRDVMIRAILCCLHNLNECTSKFEVDLGEYGKALDVASQEVTTSNNHVDILESSDRQKMPLKSGGKVIMLNHDFVKGRLFRVANIQIHAQTMEALDRISNNTWPHEEGAVKKQFVRSLLRLWKLWIETKGGKQPGGMGRHIKSQKSVTPAEYSATGAKISRNAVLERSLSTLSLVTIYDPSFQSAMSALVILELLCLEIVKAHRDQFYWRIYLARGALIFHFPIKPLAKIFYSKLQKVAMIGKETQGHYLPFGILTAMIKPNVKKAVSLLLGYSRETTPLFTRWSEERGDIAGIHASNLYLGIMCLMMGESFDSVETVLLRLTSDANSYDPLWIIRAILLRKRLLEMNFEASQTYFIKFREAMAKSAIAHNPVSQAGLFYMDSVSSVMAGNLTDAISLFRRAATNALFINKLSVNAMEIMWSYGVFVWLIIDSKGFGFPESQKAHLNPESKQNLILALQDSCKLMRFLGEKHEICQCCWVLHLYVAALDIVKGKPEVAVSKLSQQLISRRRDEIADLKLISATYYGVIARYSMRQADKLDKGVAYIQQDFLVTVMIDISGYSKVTSMLTKLGKISSEIITRTVGAYLNQLINVVSHYNGDIVKFLGNHYHVSYSDLDRFFSKLGDAILVTFESIDKTNNSRKESTEHDVMIRAILCCLHILNECSEFEVDLGEYGKSLAVTSQVNQTTSNHVADNWESSDRRMNSLKKQQSVRLQDHGKTMLYLHLAMTAGTTSRVVMGIPSERLDYSISGDHLSILGTILEGTSQGELGIDNDVWKSLFEYSTVEEQVTRYISFAPGFVKCSTLACQKLSNHFFCDFKVDIDKYTSVSNQDYSSEQPNVAESRLAKFVNQSVWKKLMASRLRMRGSVDDHKEVEKVVVSAPEFRTVTVVFVKLHSEFNKRLSQVATAGFLLCLKKYEGVFQQFSVDDKGQTFLAVFGLPPLSHPNEPEQAVKAMAEYVDFANEYLRYKVSIGLSTGEILFATLGNDSRREAGLLGDIVNLAARLMSLKNLGEIIIDEATHTGSAHLFEHTDIGEHQVKGKEDVLHLWNVTKAVTNSLSDVQLTDDISGYDEERSVIMQAYKEWKDLTKDGIIIVEGASGLGKSRLGTYISNLAGADAIPVCLVQGRYVKNDSVNASDERKLAISKFMEYHGQDPDMAPLLGIVAPLLKLEDTFKTERLDPQAKNNLLKSLLLRIFNSFVAKHKCVFLFDDSQEFVALLSRPIALSGSEILQNIAKNQKAKHIELKGLSREAVEDIIGKKFQQSGKPILKIQEYLLDAIVQKGSCFPLYTDMMGFLLQDKVGNELIIDNVGCLKLRSDISDVNSVLLDTVSAGIMAQFDRLPAAFQGLLRVACCLGQYFNLDVVRKVGDFDMHPPEMKKFIEQHDRYNFLQVTEDDDHHDSNDANDSSIFSCSFRHISIMNAIYESLSYSERVSVNLTAAKQLETSLTPENEDLVLPILCFHYSRTNNHGKHLWCLESLGCKYVAQCTFFEGIQTLTKLEELYKSLEAAGAFTVDRLRRGRWLSELSWASVKSKNMDVAVSAAMKALDLLTNNTWPHEEAAVKKQFVRSLLRLWKLWIGTKGGTQPLNKGRHTESQKSVAPFNSSATGEKLSRNAVLERSLSTLSLVTIYDPSFQSAMSALVVIELLCLVIVKAYRDPSVWRVYLARGTLIFHFPLKPLAKIFYSKLIKVDMMGKQTLEHCLPFGILTAIIKPNAAKAVSLLLGYLR